MKKLIAALVVLVLLLVAAPWVAGSIARARMDRAYESMHKKAPYLRVTAGKWTGGWLHSEHVVTFELVLPNMNPHVPALSPVVATPTPGLPQLALPRSLSLSLRERVLHGPWLGRAGIGLARVDSQFALSEAVRKTLVEVLGTDQPLRIVTRMGMLGGTTITVSGEHRHVAFDKLAPQLGKGTIDWGDFSLSISTGHHADSYDANGRQPRIEVSEPDSGLRMLASDITLNAAGKRIVDDLYDGGATFRIGKLSYARGGKPLVDVDAIESTASIVRKGDYVDYAVKVGSGPVRGAAVDAGGVGLQEMHSDLTVRHLHIATLQKLLSAIQAANAKVFDGATDPQAALQPPLREQGIELLKHDPELWIDRIGVVTSQGAGTLRGSVKFTGVTDADLAAGALALLPKLAADFTLEIAQSLAERIPGGATLSGPGVDGGYLVRKDGKLVSHLEYRQGSLLVNGKAPRMPQNLQLPGLTPPAPR